MSPLVKLTGGRYGRWTVLSRQGVDSRGEAMWLCRCDCGTTASLIGSSLRMGRSRSCGCLRDEVSTLRSTTHGHTSGRGYSPTYVSWQAMIRRCTKPTVDNYKYYGGRGITVCAEWRSSFEAFLRDMGERPSLALSIDRIDPDGNYEPGNCRWATRHQQAINKSRMPR